jgi:hypothetical protein
MANDRTLNTLAKTVADQSQQIQSLTARLIEAREQIAQYEHPDSRFYRHVEAAIGLLSAGTNILVIARALKTINGGKLQDAVKVVNAARGILRVNAETGHPAELMEAMS